MARARKVRSALRAARAIAQSGGERELERFRGLFDELDAEQRRELFAALTAELGVRQEAVEEGCRRVLETAPGSERDQAIAELRERLRAPRRRFLENLLALPGGMELMLRTRAEVLAAQRAGGAPLEVLERDIADLLNQWFCQGFLVLREIDQSSSYREIRFLKEHELVHPMVSLDEMGRRLGHDRRCYGLYHRALSDAPVVFIEVALTRGLARSIHEILDQPPSEGEGTRPNTAVFYSINSVEHGLAGLGLGKILVFQVMQALREAEPGLRSFVTLSPVPGFRTRFLDAILSGEDAGYEMTRGRLLATIPERSRGIVLQAAAARTAPAPDELGEALRVVLADAGWIDDPHLSRALARPLRELAFHYLTREKDGRGKPANPVAAFHLGNGATVRPGTVHFRANRSPAGVLGSCSLMVNYVYSRSWQQQIGRTMQSLLPWGRRG